MTTKITTIHELRQHRQDHTKENSWWVNDVRGIPLCRVCDECCDSLELEYKPEVLGTSGRYEDAVEEQIEDDY